MPHKGAALALADELSETAREIGAANTLVFADGEIRAENTDAGGLLRALPGSPAGKRALVLGAGGAARAVVWALLREGAEVAVWNRTELRSRNLCEELGGEPVAEPDQAAYELIVNSTAVGLGGEDPFAELPLDPDGFSAGQASSTWSTAASRPRCCAPPKPLAPTAVDGIEILVQQGALSLEIWTGRKPPLDTMRAAARG